jgi:hypothetical protein
MAISPRGDEHRMKAAFKYLGASVSLRDATHLLEQKTTFV